MEFIPEPYRTKTVERITLLPRDQRLIKLTEAHFNIFKIKAADIFIDLLTDSGTSAMSDNQWAGLMTGDESYAGCNNYFNCGCDFLFGFWVIWHNIIHFPQVLSICSILFEPVR